MKVRILRPIAWDTNGIQLTRFNVGDTHDIPESTAIYLILSGLVTAVENDPETDRIVATVERENSALRDELRTSVDARKAAQTRRRRRPLDDDL